jgi:hypothetical protein
LLPIKDTFDATGKPENHITMICEITQDEVDDGDIYTITTKYHKEQNDIAYIGWSYFGYLIE